MRFLFSLIFFFTIVISFAQTDLLILNDQKKFSGEIVKVKKNFIIFKKNNVKYKIPKADILTFELENKSTDSTTQSIDTVDICQKAIEDASKFHGKENGHVILGFLFGPISIIGTALSKPSPNNGKKTIILSKNTKLFDNQEYLMCYKKKAKMRLVGNEALGWGAWIMFYFVINVF